MKIKSTIYEIMLILGIYPGLMLFSTEMGLSYAVSYKNLYITSVVIIFCIKCIHLKIKKLDFAFLTFGTLMQAALIITDSRYFRPEDGYYILYWTCFTWVAVRYILSRGRKPYRAIALLTTFLSIDAVITINLTSGGGIFHQHRFSGILLFLLTLYFYESEYEERSRAKKYLPLALLFLSIAAIYTTIYVHTTRQMLLYASASLIFCINIIFFSKNLSMVTAVWNTTEKTRLKQVLLLFLLIFLALLPLFHLSGYFGNLLYYVTSLIGKERSIDQNAGREALFMHLSQVISNSPTQWFRPWDFSMHMRAGSVSAHNLWIQTYIQFGLIFSLMNLFLIIYLMQRFINIMPVMRHDIRAIFFLLLAVNLIIFSFNDEGWIFTRAPAISLWWTVILALVIKINRWKSYGTQ